MGYLYRREAIEWCNRSTIQCFSSTSVCICTVSVFIGYIDANSQISKTFKDLLNR